MWKITASPKTDRLHETEEVIAKGGAFMGYNDYLGTAKQPRFNDRGFVDDKDIMGKVDCVHS